MIDWVAESRKITGLDPVWKEKARRRLKEQTRPEKSLGLLEDLLEQLAAIQKRERPSVSKKRILVFAADHGVTEEGVSLFPRNVTEAMVLNFLNGGATINALARHINATVDVIDMGVDADFRDDSRLIHAKIARGTKNMAKEPAMDRKELEKALKTGWDLVHRLKQEGAELLGLGEMGIGNTTAASAVIAALLKCPAAAVTGRGTGLGDPALTHKIHVIQRTLDLHERSFSDPLSVLQHVGGFEIAGMTGAILAAVRLGIPVVIDGWIVSSAALVAVRLNPTVLEHLFFAHRSHERGHQILLEALKARPILDLSMRLGEGSGAALAMGILDAAVRIYNEVATFAEAGVSERKK